MVRQKLETNRTIIKKNQKKAHLLNQKIPNYWNHSTSNRPSQLTAGKAWLLPAMETSRKKIYWTKTLACLRLEITIATFPLIKKREYTTENNHRKLYFT